MCTDAGKARQPSRTHSGVVKSNIISGLTRILFWHFLPFNSRKEPLISPPRCLFFSRSLLLSRRTVLFFLLSFFQRLKVTSTFLCRVVCLKDVTQSLWAGLFPKQGSIMHSCSLLCRNNRLQNAITDQSESQCNISLFCVMHELQAIFRIMLYLSKCVSESFISPSPTHWYKPGVCTLPRRVLLYWLPMQSVS